MKVIGCGTGRCGTTSLARLLDECGNFQCNHELKPLLPWDIDMKEFEIKHSWFVNKRKHNISVGDIAFAYLPYIELFIKNIPDIKVICLKRNKDDTVESFMNWRHHGNRFLKGSEELYPNFPKYNIKDITKATEKYYDEYYKKAKKLEKHFKDNFKIFDINKLNSNEGQDEIFNFIRMPQCDRQYRETCHLNKR